MTFSLASVGIRPGVSGRTKAFLARQLSTMLASGLPLNAAINVLGAQAENPALKAALAEVETDLESGASFSQAAIKHPAVFHRVFISVIVSGEQVGQLSTVLGQLADQLERDAEFFTRVRGALYYPAFIVAAMVIVAAVMLLTIVPQLEGIFAESNAKLPWITVALLWASQFLGQYWWAVLLVLLGLVGYLITYLRSRAGERIVGTIFLHLPMGLGYDIAMARMNRTLGMLIQAGTPILEAIMVTSTVIDNVYYEAALVDAAEQVKRGVPLSEPLKANPIFPTIVSQMITVGEQTGQLDTILGNLANFYEQQADEKIRRVASLVEPMVIALVGLGVGFLVYAILVPIYSIAQLQ